MSFVSKLKHHAVLAYDMPGSWTRGYIDGIEPGISGDKLKLTWGSMRPFMWEPEPNIHFMLPALVVSLKPKTIYKKCYGWNKVRKLDLDTEALNPINPPQSYTEHLG